MPEEFRKKEDELVLQLEAASRTQSEKASIASKAFELSQNISDKWLTADLSTKRRIMEIVCLNFVRKGATLAPVMKKPFDILAEGLVLTSSRGGGI